MVCNLFVVPILICKLGWFFSKFLSILSFYLVSNKNSSTLSADSKDMTQPLKKLSSYMCFPKSKANNINLILWKAQLHGKSIHTGMNEQNMPPSLPQNVCSLPDKWPRSDTVKFCIILDSLFISDQILFIHVHGTH